MQFSSQRPNVALPLRPLPTIRVRALRDCSAGSIVVSPPGCDDMGAVLQGLGFSFLQASDGDAFKAALSSARVAFLNCCGVSAEPEIIDGLRSCLQLGGVVYAGDFTADCLEALGIQGLGFYPRQGVPRTVKAHLIDPELKVAMGRDCVDIQFDLSGWVLVKHLPNRARVLLRATVTLEDAQSGSFELVQQPLAFSLPVGRGIVFFTSFHNRAQITGVEKGLLSSVAVKTIAVATGKTMQQVITERRLSQQCRG